MKIHLTFRKTDEAQQRAMKIIVRDGKKLVTDQFAELQRKHLSLPVTLFHL